jgi:hypothetical protein
MEVKKKTIIFLGLGTAVAAGYMLFKKKKPIYRVTKQF